MFGCEDRRATIKAYAESRLTTEQQQEFEDHLDTCPDCILAVQAHIGWLRLERDAERN